MLTLYQAEWCPYCHRVRQVMTELELTYTCVNVPLARPDRAQVRELSGQEAVPVLKDGRKVIVGSSEIIAHLRRPIRPPTTPRGTPRSASTASSSSSTWAPTRRSRCCARRWPPSTSASSRRPGPR